MGASRKSTEERQAEIAEAALKLIAARGVAGLTVSALAGELGLTGGALYRHFPSTEAILEAVARRVAAQLDAATPADTLSPREWLLELARLRTALVGGNAGMSRLLLNDQLALALSPAALDVLAGAVQRTREGILRALRAGQASGELRDDLPAAALAPIVLGTIQLMAMQGGIPRLAKRVGDPVPIFGSLLRLLEPPSGPGRRKPGSPLGEGRSPKASRRKTDA